MQPTLFVASPAVPQRAPTAFAASWLLVFSIPWDDMILLPQQVQLARVLSLLVALIWIASLLREGHVRRPDIAYGWMGVFVLWACLSVFWSNSTEQTVRRSLSYLQLFAIAWTVYQFSANRSRYHKLLQAFLLGEYVLVVCVFFAFYSGRALGDGRYTAPGVNPNDLACTLALGVPIACYLFVLRSHRWSWLHGLYVPAAVVCIILNASRGGLLTLAAAAVFPFLLLSRLRWRTRLAMAVFLALSTWAALGLAESNSWRRLSTIREQFATRNLNGRFDVWSTGLDLFQRHPFAGIGAGAFTSTTGGKGTLAIAGHNSFLEVLVENGAIGLVLFLGILASVGRNRWRDGRLETQLWRTMLVTWVVANLAISWENKNVTWLLWGLALGYPSPPGFPVVFAFPRKVVAGSATPSLAEAAQEGAS